MSEREDERTGGHCARGSMWDGEPHVSTSPDIDVSRRVAVHICDRCQCLFVPVPKKAAAAKE